MHEDDAGGVARPPERARHVVEVGKIAPVAGNQVVQNFAGSNRVRLPRDGQAGIVLTLQPALCVPLRLAVTHVIEEGSRHQSCARAVSP